MSDSNNLPLLSEADVNPVPVFNCHVILSPADDAGRIQARVANFPDITAAGSTERDVLTSVMKQFKKTVMQLRADGKPLPWIDPPETPAEGESERFIPVHL
ncbi:hypothetical protein [Fuerstiella marisgermanici]|uniref:Uncharacterized protein n=1 Tax=Fuerstiella marisgermanici TaxID=1891926 RepID=A0A1P8WIH8_9PLAN|nr:hypothetical protein [Fuerstiella marisgermanici]APZ93858.1 hypothetical protein Fuma_03476 [Fuerstiella marisgermanici]